MSEPRTVFRVGEADRGKRLDRFLGERIPGLSRRRIQEAIGSRVSLSWLPSPRSATPVRPGGEVRIAHTSITEVPLLVAIPVLARGEGWLAVDKPPGLPVHPVNTVRENTLIRMLRRQEGDEDLRLAHRLDRETSGALLVAANALAASRLSVAFENGRVRKEYLAIVAGCPDADEGIVDLPIGEPSERRVFVRRVAGNGGQSAMTRWRVKRRLDGCTLLQVLPETGRRHQIRVHLAAIGHPVLGDVLYGRPDRDYLDLVRGVRDSRRDGGGPLRQLLHSARIVFPDPAGASRGDIEILAPTPRDIETVLDAGGVA